MICLRKTTIFTLSLATTWSAAALAQPPSNGPQPPPEAYTACAGKQPGAKASFTNPLGDTISGTCEQQRDGRLLLRPDHFGMGTGNGRPPVIPPAAYQSCIGKKLGDSVQISIPGGMTISGTCQSDGERLYLRPDGPPPGMKLNINDDQFPALEDEEFDDEQYQPPQPEDRPSDTRQQAPDQEEEDNSSDYQQQSPSQEDMHSDMQQQEPSPTRNGNGRPTPPEAAYKACEGKSVGDEAQLTTPQGRTITGTCQQDGDRLFLRPTQPGPPNGGSSSENNMQQQQSDPAGSADQAAVQQSQQSVQQPTQQSVQKPQEKPRGFVEKAKDFWRNLW